MLSMSPTMTGLRADSAGGKGRTGKKGLEGSEQGGGQARRDERRDQRREEGAQLRSACARGRGSPSASHLKQRVLSHGRNPSELLVTHQSQVMR